MIGVELRTRGIPKAMEFLRDFKRRCPIAGKQAQKTLARQVKKSAKIRARKDTREMSDSIDVRWKGDEIVVTVGKHYAIYQETGFNPHWIHRDMWESGEPNIPNEFIFVRNYRPFMRPAVDKWLTEDNIKKVVMRKIKAVIR